LVSYVSKVLGPGSQVLTDEEEALERYKVVIHAMQDVFGVRGGWAHVAY
jgi:hypothetical protein